MPKPPNILFLMSDEHRADVAGFAGDPVVRTPVLDELARTGVVFQNAYTPSPICIPGRQCMMTGKLPRTIGCEWFGQDLAPDAMTFAKRFSQEAWATVCCGKLHHVGRDQMQGWNQRFAADMFINDSFISDRNEAAFARLAKADRRWKWPDLMEIHRTRPDTVTRNQKFDQRTVEAAHDFIDDFFIDPTYDRATPDRPLLLKVSLIQPHYPYITTPDRLRYYFNRVTPFLDEPLFDHPFLSERAVRVPEDATPREIRRATAAYYGMIETIDDHYGRVLDALEAVGQDLDDWIIIYTSDHGEMLGEHGIWEKQKFYEASARVPLIIRWPRGFAGGRVIDANVNLCDLFATLCDLTGIPAPAGLDSRSLGPLLRGEDAPWDNETVSQFGGSNLMIKRDALKYQFYGVNGPEVLFDLARDPAERVNYIDDPAYAEAVVHFRARCAALGFGPDADPDYVNAGYV